MPRFVLKPYRSPQPDGCLPFGLATAAIALFANQLLTFFQTLLKRKELLTTETELKAIAPASTSSSHNAAPVSVPDRYCNNMFSY